MSVSDTLPLRWETGRRAHQSWHTALTCRKKRWSLPAPVYGQSVGSMTSAASLPAAFDWSLRASANGSQSSTLEARYPLYAGELACALINSVVFTWSRDRVAAHLHILPDTCKSGRPVPARIPNQVLDTPIKSVICRKRGVRQQGFVPAR